MAEQRPSWLPEISDVAETIDGLFGRNEGDTEMLHEAFAFAAAEAREQYRQELVAAVRERIDARGDCSPIAESAEEVLEYGEGYCDGVFWERGQLRAAVLELLQPPATTGSEPT